MSVGGPEWVPPPDNDDDEKYQRQQAGSIPLSDTDREVLEN